MNPDLLVQRNDLAWKEIITQHLKDFTEFFWPDAYDAIAWDKPYFPLEQTLQQPNINIKNNLSSYYVDKLFQVSLKAEPEDWLALHIEIQHSKQPDFAKRMFNYFTRIYAQYDRSVASLAVLADKDPKWRPNQYKHQLWNNKSTREYVAIKILDYQGQEHYLRKITNPFGLVIIAQLNALRTTPYQKARLLAKLELCSDVFKHNWPPEQTEKLCIFINNLLVLENSLEQKYISESKKIEEKHKMALTLRAAEFAYKDGTEYGQTIGFEQGIAAGKAEGKAEGISQGMAAALIKILQARFEEIASVYLDRINAADPDTLNTWIVNCLYAENIGEVFR